MRGEHRNYFYFAVGLIYLIDLTQYRFYEGYFSYNTHFAGI